MFHKTGAGGRLASCSLESEDILHFNIKVNCELEVIPVNWTQKFEPPGGQISKP